MTRLARIFAASLTSWRPLVPFAALFALLIVFAVGGMLVVAREADRSDASRAREAVSRTFDSVLTRLASAVEMNAAAPPIASALSGARATPPSAYGYLNFTSTDALGYYGAVVLNHDGSAFAGTRFGLPWAGPELARAARIVAPVAARLHDRNAGIVHAVVRDGQGRALAVAVTNVMPAVADLTRQGEARLPRRLAMIAPVDLQVAPKMLPSLGVEDFRIVAASDGDNAVTIAVENGAPVVFEWRSRKPGRAAIARWAPAIGALFLAALVMLIRAGRTHMEAIRALERLANHDPLTGLANRSAFRNEIERRQGRGDPVALGMLDLNGFKAVNDEHGHLIGDELLQAVAAEFARSAHAGDFVARLGGDEFAWISASNAAAERLSRDFGERIARPLPVRDLRLLIGAATGIALAHPGVTPSALMALADARLYDSKRAAQRAGNRRPGAPARTGRRTKSFCY